MIIAENGDQLSGLLGRLLELVPPVFRPWVVPVGLLVLGLLFARVVGRFVARLIRGRRSPNIHPLLQKYNVDHAELDRQRREQARLIVATSTTTRLAGFRIVRQVEAVFVEGYRTPEEALIALKAAAADRGANAILNVHTDRTAAGRCTASGDAIIVIPPAPPPKPDPDQPE
ncbi:MAG: hypothetical protein GXY55_15630 [Phycisphaerae bacterium]|nr:hypothetical protein [Phycisphaerae bacterium]